MKRYLIAGALTGTIVAAIYAAPAATQGRPAAPAVRIQAGDGGTLGLAHTLRFGSPAALDGGVAFVGGAAGAVTVKGSDGNNCVLTFTGGMLTAETCP